jgi:thiamine-monophosphate kinase
MSNNVGRHGSKSSGGGESEISIGELGEFGLIARVTARLPVGAATLVGPGDDAAVVSTDDGRVVATTDVLVDGQHFRRDWSTPYDVGRKAAAQNLADVAAMGAVPTALLIGLATPPDLPAFWAERFADGLSDECAVVGAGVVGGDVVRSELLDISVTALGDLQGRAPVLRSGARAGDVVAVAGRLGWAAAGLAALRRGFRTPRAVVDAHRRPQPPYAAGPAAARAGATALIDVSDGLVADLGHVASASGVVISISRAALTVPDVLAEVASALGADPLDWVLGGGEDHALAGCFPSSDVMPEGWLVIGQVSEVGVIAQDDASADVGNVLVDGRAYTGGGFDHFR